MLLFDVRDEVAWKLQTLREAMIYFGYTKRLECVSPLALFRRNVLVTTCGVNKN